MTFGDLTDQEKLLLEQRTSAFFNLAGVRAQEVLGASDTGLSTRKIYKILANAIQDWTWLSFRVHDRKEFKFRGIGGLTWIPHRFGALGLVRPHIQYTVTFHYGLFPNIIDLVAADEYAKYGCVSKEESGTRRIVFPSFLTYEVLRKLPVEGNEQHFWSKLVEVYARLDGDTLDAMASCRTRTTAAHSLWIQFVHWKREMGIALDRLREDDPVLMDQKTKESVRKKVESARACMHSITAKMGFRQNLGQYVERVKSAAALTELSNYLPCLDELDPAKTPTLDFDKFVRLYPYLAAMSEICEEYLKQTDILPATTIADLGVIEQRLRELGRFGSIRRTLIDPRRWFTLLRPPKDKNKEIARLCLELITELFRAFEQELTLPIARPTEHYSDFLASHYPLPVDHFLPGF